MTERDEALSEEEESVVDALAGALERLEGWEANYAIAERMYRVLRDCFTARDQEVERLVEAAREAALSISMRVHFNDSLEDAFEEQPPMWARDSFNADDACRCGYCGAWMTVVRPGKVQCDYCGDNPAAGALVVIRTALKPWEK